MSSNSNSNIKKPLNLCFYYFTDTELKEIHFEVFPKGTNIIIDDDILAIPDDLSIHQLFNDIKMIVDENMNEKIIKNDYLLAA